MDSSFIFATLATTLGALSLFFLLVLHFASPEFQPSWRMVSEYALGKHKWLLTSFFIFWGLSTLSASMLILSNNSTIWVILGSILIAISGIGAIMGGLFDVNHKLHGLSFALGVPTFPIGALIVAYQLGEAHKMELLVSAHSLWISVVLMGGSMALLFSGLKQAGIPFGPDQEPLDELPKGVIGVNGWANRLLVLVYIVFNFVVASAYLGGN